LRSIKQSPSATASKRERKKHLPSNHAEQAVLDPVLDAVRVDAPLAPDADSRSTQRKVLRWLNRGSLAILDQGLISGSNFLGSILLARWLVPESYGAYAVAFGILVLLTLVYSALILEPMSVYGGAAYRSCLMGYVKSLLKMHAALSLVFALLVSCGALAVSYSGKDAGLAGALFGIAIASPFVLLLWVLRRALYLKMHSGRAATGAMLYFVLMIAGLWMFNSRSLLSPFYALLLMGAAALVASLLLMAFLREDLGRDSVPAPSLSDACIRHWQYGRWALASSFVAWIPAYIFLPLLTAFAGMAKSGELKALTNFVAPLDQTLAALSLLFLPHAARVRAERSHQDVRSLTRNLLLLSIAGSAVYWLIVINLHGPVFNVLYSGRYSDVSFLLPAVALGSILWSAAYGPAIALRAMESPKSVFTAYFVTSLVCLIVGIPATRYFGLKGAIWSGNLADFASLIVILFILYRKLGETHSGQLQAVAIPGDSQQ
jgi:O-antigen/teichoic acid export membrane protein